MQVSSPRIIAATLVAALVGAGTGAGAYALFSSDNESGTTTVVRQVHVTQSLQTAAKSGTALSIGSIYRLAHKAVVEIFVTSSSNPFERAQRAQGSGFVY